MSAAKRDRRRRAAAPARRSGRRGRTVGMALMRFAATGMIAALAFALPFTGASRADDAPPMLAAAQSASDSLRPAPIGTQPTPAQPASGLPSPPASTPAKSDLVKALEVGGGLGWYSDDLGRADGEFVRFSLSRPYDFGVTLDVGRQARFGETSVGGGISYTKDFPGDRSISVGLGGGEGNLAPRYRFDVSARQALFDVIFSAGYTRIQSKGDNRSDGFAVGATRWFAQWIAGGYVRQDYGYPGRTKSTGAGVGLTWYVWRRIYIGGGVDWGNVSYQVLPGRVLVDYESVGYNLGFSRWFNGNSGVNLRVDYGETSFYETGGFTVSVFREW